MGTTMEARARSESAGLSSAVVSSSQAGDAVPGAIRRRGTRNAKRQRARFCLVARSLALRVLIWGAHSRTVMYVRKCACPGSFQARPVFRGIGFMMHPGYHCSRAVAPGRWTHGWHTIDRGVFGLGFGHDSRPGTSPPGGEGGSGPANASIVFRSVGTHCTRFGRRANSTPQKYRRPPAADVESRKRLETPVRHRARTLRRVLRRTARPDGSMS
jgi:hypothetical protein